MSSVSGIIPVCDQVNRLRLECCGEEREEVRLLHPLSVAIKSNISEVEHLSSSKCQGSDADQTSPFEGPLKKPVFIDTS